MALGALLICLPLNAAAAEADWEGLAFDRAAFDEIVDLATHKHLIAEVPQRAWAWAATGALRATGDVRLLPSSYVQEQQRSAEGRAALAGDLQPLRCPALREEALIWKPQPDLGPAPTQLAEVQARNAQKRAQREQVRQAWDSVPFGPAGLACVIESLLAQKPPVDVARVWRMAADGFVQALDPHSSLMPKRLFVQQESASRSVEVVDVGVDFLERKGVLLVRRVHPDAKAAHKLLARDDRLLSLDGRAAVDLTLAQVTRALQGAPGSEVTMQVQRAKGRPFDVRLLRMALRSPSVAGYLAGQDTGVGVVRVPQFATAADADLRRAVQELKLDAQGKLKALILDLRGNTGGWVEQGVAVADVFLSRGTILQASMREGPAAVLTATRSAQDLGLPLVALVDEPCRSACEMVTAALQDNERALVLGQRTYGKGTVQQVVDAQRGPWSLIITMAQYLSPAGRSLQAKGVKPDVALPLADTATLTCEADLPGHVPPATELPEHDCKLLTPKWQTCAAALKAESAPWRATMARQDAALLAAVDAARCLRR